MKPYQKRYLPQRGHIESVASWRITNIKKSISDAQTDYHEESWREIKVLSEEFPDNEVVGQINPVFMRLSGLENSLLQRVLQQILM